MTRMPDPNVPECDCRALERWSKEPSIPIEFDAKLNEYHIRGTDGGQIMIYHCPFCGGRTPESRRDDFFMHITHAEMRRLNMLTGHLKTLEEVLAAFGPPDYDNPTGTGVTKDDEAGRPVTKFYRQLTTQACPQRPMWTWWCMSMIAFSSASCPRRKPDPDAPVRR